MEDAPKGRTRRRVIGVVVLILAALVVRWTSDTSPVGHFASAQDKDRYVAAYRAALDELPPPQEVTDVRTTFGIVRLYRFTGANDDDSPLLLLPGRAAAAPMWADNPACCGTARSGSWTCWANLG